MSTLLPATKSEESETEYINRNLLIIIRGISAHITERKPTNGLVFIFLYILFKFPYITYLISTVHGNPERNNS